MKVARVADDLPETVGETLVLPLRQEELTVDVHRHVTGRVRISTVTTEREEHVDEELTGERVEVEHVPVGRIVDAIPPVRTEGDTTIIPVVEEVLVVERRLMLREEVHMRRIRTVSRHQETVVLRQQHAVETREEPDVAETGEKFSQPASVHS